jgi:hypothetical protein
MDRWPVQWECAARRNWLFGVVLQPGEGVQLGFLGLT